MWIWPLISSPTKHKLPSAHLLKESLPEFALPLALVILGLFWFGFSKRTKNPKTCLGVKMWFIEGLGFRALP